MVLCTEERIQDFLKGGGVENFYHYEIHRKFVLSEIGVKGHDVNGHQSVLRSHSIEPRPAYFIIYLKFFKNFIYFKVLPGISFLLLLVHCRITAADSS